MGQPGRVVRSLTFLLEGGTARISAQVSYIYTAGYEQVHKQLSSLCIQDVLDTQ